MKNRPAVLRTVFWHKASIVFLINMLYHLTMKRNKGELEISQRQISLSEFLESYNQNIPADFPRASVVNLKKFQGTHPTLFKSGDMWSIDQHRKRMIDWLSGNREVV